VGGGLVDIKNNALTGPWSYHGGFVIENSATKKIIVRVKDLSKVCSWLDAIVHLLSKKPAEPYRTPSIPYLNGTVTLTRVGRGGTMLSIKVVLPGEETQKVLIDFGSFCKEIRQVSKEYFPLVGSCRVVLQKLRRNITQPQAAAFKEKEEWLQRVLGHDRLNEALKTIKNNLGHGAIPRSNLPVYFQQKHDDKVKRKKQEDASNAHIMDFVLKNLPPLWEETKTASSQLSVLLKQQREHEQHERIERYEAARRERFEKSKSNDDNETKKSEDGNEVVEKKEKKKRRRK